MMRALGLGSPLMMRALALLGLVGPVRAQYIAPGRPGAFGCIPCLDAYFVAPGPESMPGAYAPNRPDPDLCTS